MLRATPPGEDGLYGTHPSTPHVRGRHPEVAAQRPSKDGSGRDPSRRAARAPQGDERFERGTPIDPGMPPGMVQDEGDRRSGIDFLQLVATAEQQANLYVQQVNRKTWSRAYRAFHNEHFAGSKYTHRDWAHRSKIFVPKTRSATRKDVAAV